MKIILISLKNACILAACLLVLPSCTGKGDKSAGETEQLSPGVQDTTKQRSYLDWLLGVLPPDKTNMGRVSFLDETFRDWLKRTGELPPDFDRLPSVPDLPDPLILDEGGKNIPVKTMEQWNEKRVWMKKQLENLVTGTYPPSPDNLKAEIISEKKDGQTKVQTIELSFGPDRQAKLTIELMIPPGKGPFPVFLTQWNHREWALIAVKRGYIGCVYAGADAKDDTEKYSEIWSMEYDFSRLMRRAYGAYRAIDYLYTLSFVDKDKIGLTGHSRNGKLSLMAAAFDERIKAVIPSSGGTGAEIPWRYCSHKYDIEDLAYLTCAQPSWFHPRLRFFAGREDRLPVDQNSFMALIAPRGLMLSTAITEQASNPWGIEQAYHTSMKVYKFLGAEKNLAIRSRYGKHSVSARDLEDYIDFFDYVFGRSSHKPENRLFYPYTFEKWCGLSGEKINPESFPVRNPDDLLKDAKGNQVSTIESWNDKRAYIREQIKWVLGDEPSGVINPGPQSFSKGGNGEDNFGNFIPRPVAKPGMGCLMISPYNGFGDNLFGYLYYPIDEKGNPAGKSFPVVVYLHEYDYSKGFTGNYFHKIPSYFEGLVNLGFAVFSYDMLGCGNRIEEGTRFYERYPHWSKMGKMVADLRSAVDALANLERVDKDKIFVTGYSMGATVGLFAASMDERIAGIVSVCGFTPMRTDTPGKGTEGIRAYSHLHGLLPRLGYFYRHENRIPLDFDEIIASIAPRPLLVIAPVLDKDATHRDVEYCVQQSRKVYDLYGSPDNIEMYSPEDYSRFSDEIRNKTFEWFKERLQ